MLTTDLQLFAGNPARKLRDLKPNELQFLRDSAEQYAKNAEAYRQGLRKVVLESNPEE
jgi:carbonic anhydrase/acetyltransferase-like protein (isoleucine patch superfamily)